MGSKQERVHQHQNEDDKCFKYSVQCSICKVYEKDHPERLSHYKNLTDELNWTNVNCPSSNIDYRYI